MLPPAVAEPSPRSLLPAAHSMMRTIPLACFTLLFSVGRLLLAADEPSAEQIRFFEEKIRPVIAESCYECHSDKKQQGDVRLDRRDAVFPHLIAPGEPDKSRLLQVLKHDPNDTQMPPKGKLPQDKIDLLTEWVRQGAPGQLMPQPRRRVESPPSREWRDRLRCRCEGTLGLSPDYASGPTAPRSPRPRQHTD